MTNLQSFSGAILWVAVAALLMLITFEPVAIEQTPSALFIAAEAPASAHIANA